MSEASGAKPKSLHRIYAGAEAPGSLKKTTSNFRDGPPGVTLFCVGNLMFRRPPAFFSSQLFLLLAAAAPAASRSPSRRKPSTKKRSGISTGASRSSPTARSMTGFRLTGRVFAPDSSRDLKARGQRTRHDLSPGNDVVSVCRKNAGQLHDVRHACAGIRSQAAGNAGYLTRSVMETLRLSFFWSTIICVRRRRDAQASGGAPGAGLCASTRRICSEKYEWWFEFEIPSENVPVTDSLVILGARRWLCCARVAARHVDTRTGS